MPAPPDRPLLIVGSGPPAAGKTTLAREIASAKGLPCLTRDAIQSRIVEAFPDLDRSHARAFGAASYAILYDLLDGLLAAGVSLVVEANFRPAADRRRLQRVVADHGVLSIECHLHASGETLIDRFESRSAGTATSGAAELEHLDPTAFLRALDAGTWGPLDLGGPILMIDTDNVPVELAPVLELLRG